MSLTANEVQSCAYLARVAIDHQDIDAYAEDLSRMLDLMISMGDVETQNIEPMAHPMDLAQQLRADIVTETNNREKFQAIAPQIEAGLYLVPQVIE